jgi:hypothetical protein
MGAEASKNKISPDHTCINIYVQDESENKIIVELPYNALITDLKKIIHEKINCTSKVIFCENNHISIYFNKTYKNVHRFSVDENDEISLHTISHYNIVEGDTVRYRINPIKYPIGGTVINVKNNNTRELVNYRIVHNDDLGKRGDDTGSGLF